LGIGTYTVCTTSGNCASAGQAVDSLNSLLGDLTLQGTAGQITVADNGTDTITLSLDSAVTLQGNTFNGANQLVQLNALSQLPAVSGALLTNLNATALTTGTVDNARLTNSGALTVTAGTGLTGGGSVALGGSTTLNVTYGNTASTSVEGDTQLTVTAGTNLTGGGTITLGDGGTLTVNVADSPTFAGDVVVQGAGGLTIGADSVQGLLILYDGGTGASAFTGSLQTATLGQNTVFTLPDPGQASASICLSTNNCNAVLGTGSVNTIPKFTASGTIGDSSLIDNGSTLTVGTLATPVDIDLTGDLTLFGGSISTAVSPLNITSNTAIQGTLSISSDATIQGGELTLGIANTQTGSIVVNSFSTSNTVTLQAGATSSSYALTLPTSLGSSGDCLVDTNGSGALGFTSCGGSTTTLQAAYNASTGGTTPEVKLDSTRGAVDIQDADTTIGSTLFNVRGSNGSGLGSAFFSVDSDGLIGIGTDAQERQLDLVANDSSTEDPVPFRILQSGSGHASMEFSLDSFSNSFYVGQDTNQSGAFVINSSSAVTESATPAYVQSDAVAAASLSTSISRAFPSDNTQGNLIAVSASWRKGLTTGDFIQCTDTQGNSYTSSMRVYDSTNDQYLATCYAPNINAGSNTVTVTFINDSAAAQTVDLRAITINEYSGVATVSPVDVMAGQGGISGTIATDNITSTAGTTTQDRDLIFGAVVDTDGMSATGTTITAGTGFTKRAEANAIATEDMVQTTAGSVAATFTFSDARRYNAVMIAFEAAALSGDVFTNALFIMEQDGAITFQNSTDSADAFRVLNASGTELFSVNTTSNRLELSAPNITMTGIGTGASGYSVLCIEPTTKNLAVSSSGTQCASSSERYKDNIEGVAEKMGLEVITDLRPVTFTYKEGDGRTKLGLIAEEVHEVLPEVVNYDEEGRPDSIDYETLVINLVKAIQQQQIQIDELQDGVLSGALVEITGHIRVGIDTAGTVTIPAGQTSATVTFSRPYEYTPKVTTGASEFVPVVVTDKSGAGFTVRTPSPHTSDIHIDWTAFEVE
jgi:hypothetical protein